MRIELVERMEIKRRFVFLEWDDFDEMDETVHGGGKNKKNKKTKFKSKEEKTATTEEITAWMAANSKSSETKEVGLDGEKVENEKKEESLEEGLLNGLDELKKTRKKKDVVEHKVQHEETLPPEKMGLLELMDVAEKKRTNKKLSTDEKSNTVEIVKEEKIKYFTEKLVSDMQKMYGGNNKEMSEASRDFKEFGVEIMYFKDPQDGVYKIDTIYGLKLAGKIKEYLSMPTGEPKEWPPEEELRKSGIFLSELEEARRLVVESLPKEAIKNTEREQRFRVVKQVEDILTLLKYVNPDNEMDLIENKHQEWVANRKITREALKNKGGKLADLLGGGTNFSPEDTNSLYKGLAIMTDPSKVESSQEWSELKVWLEEKAGIDTGEMISVLGRIHGEGKVAASKLTEVSSPSEIEKYPAVSKEIGAAAQFLKDGKFLAGWGGVKARISEEFNVNMNSLEFMKRTDKKISGLKEEVLGRLRKSSERPDGWTMKFKKDGYFRTLETESDPIKWKYQVEVWNDMDEAARNNDLIILRCLIKIKKDGLNTPEAKSLWNKHKNRLEALGLMI